jgi:large subunit ribosomal protein L7/L12
MENVAATTETAAVEAAPPAIETALPAREAAPAATVEAADVGTYDVVLVSGGENVIVLVRELRELTGLELREVKLLIDAAPRTIKPGLSRVEAERLRQRLEAIGARVALKPAR